ncbi:hypothetical protein D0Z07_5192 [Hyphodiscus hymeniophilus]|uniref:Imidazoleglycerol-phosphate dehydratase n=1 Tax=Hyphodiscus hymeniophilus TaxID=353542 RepID=A0A9P6VII3_9HELO|nr:hypothetical protein D0Z07_5192 [Hyphodiscus hymeniophilus]
MRSSGGLRYEEASGAAWEGGRGAAVGAAKWGVYSAILGGVGYGVSPIYRGLTIQFKVCLEADRRIRDYEAKVRMQKRMMRDRAAWEKYEQEFEEAATPKQQKPS